MNTLIKTPESPLHDAVIGRYFAATSFEREGTEIFFCESFDSQAGFRMTNVNHPLETRDVSIGAIGRTWRQAEDRGDHWWVPEWNSRIEKLALV